MPYWRRETLRDTVPMTFGQTYELDLPKSGLLGSLVFYIHTNGVESPLLTHIKWRLIDWISKIEVMADGATLIKSLDGVQALASAFYDDLREAASMWRTYSTTSQRQWIPLHFGRHFLDELYGLDLSKYNQVTLKITNEASSTYFNTHINLSVVGYFLQDAVGSFQGHFREEEWKTWAPAADAIEYNTLPIGLPIRRILLRARPFVKSADSKHSSSMPRSMDDIDFTFHSGEVRVYKGSLNTLGFLSIMEMPCLAETRGNVVRTAGYGFECGIGYVMQALGYGAADADSITSALANLRKDVQDSKQEVGYNPGNGPLAWVARGWGYGHCVPLFYARKEDLSDILIPDLVKQVNLNIHCQDGTTVSGTGTAAESAIVLSRLSR